MKFRSALNELLFLISIPISYDTVIECLLVFCIWIGHFARFLHFFLVSFISTVYFPQHSIEYIFVDKFGSHCTIYIFKNYFVTVFSVINFQFLINKRYLNILLVFTSLPSTKINWNFNLKPPFLTWKSFCYISLLYWNCYANYTSIILEVTTFNWSFALDIIYLYYTGICLRTIYLVFFSSKYIKVYLYFFKNKKNWGFKTLHVILSILSYILLKYQIFLIF